MARILVVEDEESIGEVIDLNLSLAGHSVVHVTSAERAQDLWDNGDKNFDIALLDIMLPGMSGVSLCEYFREMGSDIGIIMLSAKSQEQDKVIALSTGADDYINCSAKNVGFVAKTVKFIGKEAHAGGAPWDGINALNAASLALMAINSIRETLKDQDCIRIHPIITKGGTLVNIVPNDVRMEMYVRGATIDAIKDANAKVNRAIKGCAYAIGCEVEITDLPGYLPVADNLDLAYVFEANAKALYPEKIVRHEEGIGGGSSDVGDVQAIMPCIQGGIGGFRNAFHSKHFELADENLAFVAPAKVISDFAKTNENLTIKAGFLDGKVVDVATVESLAKLPSRDILLATVLGAFNAPMAAFARAVQAIVDKGGVEACEKAEEAAPAEETAPAAEAVEAPAAE